MSSQAPRRHQPPHRQPDFTLARRTSRIEPFHVMELVKRAAALQAAGHPVIHMSIGEPDFTAPAPVVDALEAAVRAGRTGYTAALGIEPLRQAIARDYGERFNLDISPERIVVTAGASAALSLACSALVEPGDQVLLTDPSYPCNRHFVAACDGVPTPVPVGPQTRFQLTADLLRTHWTPRVKGVMIASPANPTGTSIAFDELARIIEEVRGRKAFALVDEIYLDLSYGLPGAAAAPRSALELGDDLIVTNSFSKFFSMTGWRLGWLVVPQSLVPVFEKLAQNLFICPSALAQHAALACFTPQSIAIYAQRREAFRERRDYIVPALESIGLRVPAKPDGAFYVYVDCTGSGLGSTEFCSRLLDEAHVSLVPGEDFGVHEPDRYFRLSYATALPSLKEAIGRMDSWLRQHR
ncbi:MAG: pyridoxal phosphate-dependent aminotransferase [Lautropia sp.]|nr:pyridoxal phosphate-dependent aminotransferase [Lautropia sp.]